MRLVFYLLTFVSLWNCYSLADSAGIFISPESNQYISINSEANITFSCTVDGGRSVLWTIQGVQTTASNDEVIIDTNFNSSVLTITRAARDDYRANARDDDDRISVRCSALRSTSGLPQVDEGDVYYIVTYAISMETTPNPIATCVTPEGDVIDVPNTPMMFQLVASEPSLILEWRRPTNVPSVVGVNYTITIFGPTNNTGPFVTTETSFSIHFLEVERMNSSCEMFVFRIQATNDAGPSVLDQITDTIPISTNVSNISQTLAIESVNLNQGNGVEVQISFLPVRSCSRNFPVRSYTVELRSDLNVLLRDVQLDFSEEFLLDPPLDEKVFVSLNQTTIPSLRENAVYSVSVNVCSNVTCRESESLPIYTTDVQNVMIYFFENNIFVECSLAANSSSKGCVVRLILDGNETMADELVLTRTSNSLSSLSQCNTTANQRSAYNAIFGLDLESDGTQGSVPIPVVEMEPINSAGEFTELTGCSTSGPNVAAIAVPVIVIFFLILVIIGLTVFFATHYKQHRRIKRIKSSKQARLKKDKKDPHTYVLDIDHDTTDLIIRSDTPEVARSASAPSVSGMQGVQSNGESTAELVPTNSEPRKKIKYMRSFSEGGENKSQAPPPVEVLFDRNNIRFKVNRPALRSAARRRSRTRSAGSVLSNDSEESTSLIPPVSLEVKFSEDLQRDMLGGVLSPLREEAEDSVESVEERKNDEDTEGPIVFGRHEVELHDKTGEPENKTVGNGHGSDESTTPV